MDLENLSREEVCAIRDLVDRVAGDPFWDNLLTKLQRALADRCKASMDGGSVVKNTTFGSSRCDEPVLTNGFCEKHHGE